jgi:hypothetical protein
MGNHKYLSVSIILALLFSLAGISFNVFARPLAATSPILGAADSFAVLAGTAITNVPTSAITGNVGLSPATGSNYAGLTALEVSGTIYAVDGTGPPGSVNNPGLLTSAKADLVAAYDALSAPPNVSCTVDYGAVTQDLAGLTLVPGVYCADAFQLSGTLTLNDTGNPDGVWIFRTALSTLNTTPGVGARVQFLNGIGSSCNVWWKVVSSATIGSGTSFIGNILALTSISLGTRASLDGRALARNGAVTLDQNTITRPICALQLTDTPTATMTGTTTATVTITGTRRLTRTPTSTPTATTTGTITITPPTRTPRPTRLPPISGMPGTGGEPILNVNFPWSLVIVGGFSAIALILGLRAHRRADRPKQ